jgi:protein-tyrosine phosphatase
MGNICRSPTAHAVLFALVEEAGLKRQVFVDSAGTIAHHVGEPADSRMHQHAARRGYRLTSIARQLKESDFDDFDLIVAMDHDNLSGIRQLAASSGKQSGARAHVRLFSDYLSELWPIDVPDPYYGGDQGFETVLDMIEEGCPVLLEQLIENTEDVQNSENCENDEGRDEGRAP